METNLSLVAEPRRQEILRLIWHQERCAGDIAAATNVTFGAVSQHLAKLRRAGVVCVRKQGRQRFYRVEKKALGPLAAYFEAFWQDKLESLKQMAEENER